MKQKLLLFLVSILCSVGAWADTTVFSYTMSSQDNTAGTYTATGGTTEIGSDSKYTASQGVKLDGDSGSKYVKITLSEGNSLQVGDVITLQEYSSSTPSGSDYGVAIGTTAFTAIKNLYITSGAKNNLTDVTYTVAANDGLEGESSFYAFRCSGKSTFLNAVTITRSGSNPSITASNATITATKSGVAATTEISVKGANLTGSTLTATLSPAVDYLSVSLDKTTITSGAIEATATLSYTATANVKTGTTTLTISDGTTSKNVTITYSAKVADWTLQNISEATTWDFSKVASVTTSELYNTSDKGIKLLNDDTAAGITATDPSANDEVIYANADYITLSNGFDGTSIAFKGTYPTRTNTMCQAGTLHFKTTVPGNVTVKFSDTGSSISATATPRYLIINNNKTAYWTSRPTSGETKSNDTKTVTVPVAAGDINITGSQAQCYYTVTFTPADVDKTFALGTNGYSTYCSDYAFTVSGATAYKATYANNTVTLSAIEGVIPAGEGIILNGTEGASVTISPATTTAEEINSALTGVSSVTTELATTGTNYFLASNGTTTAFAPITGVTLANMVNKAYLNIPSSTAKISIVFEGETDGINEIATQSENNGNAYNVAGQHVNANAKGLVIMNGKKYFNK